MTRQQQLEHYLDELDITNVGLARMAGVAPSSVQRWTAGTIAPPLMLLRLLECMVTLQRIRDLSANASGIEAETWERPEDETVQSA
jgi:predicted transcriptional regulator